MLGKPNRIPRHSQFTRVPSLALCFVTPAEQGVNEAILSHLDYGVCILRLALDSWVPKGGKVEELVEIQTVACREGPSQQGVLVLFPLDFNISPRVSLFSDKKLLDSLLEVSIFCTC